MGSTMTLGRAQQTDVIWFIPKMHQLIDKLLCRQATEAPVLWRNNDMEASNRLRNQYLLLQSSKLRTHGWGIAGKSL